MRLQGLVEQTQFARWLLGLFVGEPQSTSEWQAPASRPLGRAALACTACLAQTGTALLCCEGHQLSLTDTDNFFFFALGNISDISLSMPGLC